MQYRKQTGTLRSAERISVPVHHLRCSRIEQLTHTD